MLNKKMKYRQQDKKIWAMWKKGKGRYGLKAEIARHFKLTRQRIGAIIKRLNGNEEESVSDRINPE